MTMKIFFIFMGIVLIGSLGVAWYFQGKQFSLPTGETSTYEIGGPETAAIQTMQTQREVLTTDGIKHSIPLNEILSGGPGKDGIPAIDNPKFVSAAEATYLNDTDPGIGVTVKGESRFYPYRILVWHEIVNDTIA